MPLPRFDNLDETQRARILAAAQAEFARRGYEAASLAQIALEAGISKGTLYYYFADRDDLYATIVMRLVRSLEADQLLHAFAPKRARDFWPALEELFRAGFELARTHPEEIRALRSFQLSIRRHPRPVFEPVLAVITLRMRVLVETGRRLGCVRTDLSVEQLVSLLQAADEALDSEFVERLSSADERAFAQQAALALDIFRRLSEATPATQSRANKPARRKKGAGVS